MESFIQKGSMDDFLDAVLYQFELYYLNGCHTFDYDNLSMERPYNPIILYGFECILDGVPNPELELSIEIIDFLVHHNYNKQYTAELLLFKILITSALTPDPLRMYTEIVKTASPMIQTKYAKLLDFFMKSADIVHRGTGGIGYIEKEV